MHKAGKVVFRITNGSAFFVLETFTPNVKVFSIERRNYRRHQRPGHVHAAASQLPAVPTKSQSCPYLNSDQVRKVLIMLLCSATCGLISAMRCLNYDYSKLISSESGRWHCQWFLLTHFRSRSIINPISSHVEIMIGGKMSRCWMELVTS